MPTRDNIELDHIEQHEDALNIKHFNCNWNYKYSQLHKMKVRCGLVYFNASVKTYSQQSIMTQSQTSFINSDISGPQ